MNGHFVCDICGAIRPASETVHICEHARKPDALCVKECTHWGRSQEECISDHDGLCKGKDGELFRDYCDTRCACLYPAKRKLPAPPLPIRAPGHGQGTEEARVERVRKAFKVAWDTMAHVDINVDRDKIWFDKHPTMIEAMFGLSDAIKALAAADAVPGPAETVTEYHGGPGVDTALLAAKRGTVTGPGHGQGTEGERVERAARWIAADRHEGVNFWEHTDANGYSPLEKHAYREKARAVLAAADGEVKS